MTEHWLIIGASGGIAQGLLQNLLAAGHQVSAISRQPLAEPISGVSWYQLQSAEQGAADAVLTRIFQLSVTAVVICQGWLHGDGHLPEKSLQQVSREALQQSMEINLFSPVFYLQALQPWLQKQPGIRVAVLSAKVGSISDNQLGGWYSYRMAKAALNMLVRCASIELGRVNKTAALFSLHPGTTDSALSAPFQQRLPAGQLQSAAATAERLLSVIRQSQPTDSGLLLNWDGQPIPF